MHGSVAVSGLSKFSARLKATPKQISRATRSAINRTATRSRRDLLVPLTSQLSGVPISLIRRNTDILRAGRRRSFALIGMKYFRPPADQFSRYRLILLDPTHAAIEVYDGTGWRKAYAFANPSALSGDPQPLARYPRSTNLTAQDANRIISQRRGQLLIGGQGPSLNRTFGVAVDRNTARTADRLAVEFQDALRRVIR